MAIIYDGEDVSGTQSDGGASPEVRIYNNLVESNDMHLDLLTPGGLPFGPGQFGGGLYWLIGK